MASQFLNLGLFIVLLSFFIVLNSISTYEQTKTAAVLESVSQAFLTNVESEKERASDEIAPQGEGIKEGDALDKLLGAFRSAIPDVEGQKNRFGDLLSLNMSVQSFKEALIEGRDETQRFRYSISGIILQSEQAPFEVFINIYLPGSGVVQNNGNFQPHEKIKEMTELLAQFADALAAVGVDKKSIHIGFSEGPIGRMSLMVRHIMPAQASSAKGGQ